MTFSPDLVLTTATASPPQLRRRAVLAASLVAPQLVLASTGFPVKTVRIVVPYAVGVGPDVVVRALAEQLATRWVQSVIVDNKPGASGLIAFQELHNGPSDGHTLFLGDAATLATNALLYKKLPYDAARDVEPITLLFQATFVLWTGAATRWRKLSDLIRHARLHPMSLRYATLGHGHASHLALETWAHASDLQLQPIPFKDAGALFVAVASGEVDLSVFSAYTAQALYRSGRWRPLAVAADHRLAEHPDVPTLVEAGSPRVPMNPWAALVCRAPSSSRLVEQIRRDLIDAMASPTLRARVEAAGFELIPSTPGEVRERALEERRLCASLLRAGRLTPS